MFFFLGTFWWQKKNVQPDFQMRIQPKVGVRFHRRNFLFLHLLHKSAPTQAHEYAVVLKASLTENQRVKSLANCFDLKGTVHRSLKNK